VTETLLENTLIRKGAKRVKACPWTSGCPEGWEEGGVTDSPPSLPRQEAALGEGGKDNGLHYGNYPLKSCDQARLESPAR
jgi:hypothetical protein